MAETGPTTGPFAGGASGLPSGFPKIGGGTAGGSSPFGASGPFADLGGKKTNSQYARDFSTSSNVHQVTRMYHFHSLRAPPQVLVVAARVQVAAARVQAAASVAAPASRPSRSVRMRMSFRTGRIFRRHLMPQRLARASRTRWRCPLRQADPQVDCLPPLSS
jgi:hypothetical protein